MSEAKSDKNLTVLSSDAFLPGVVILYKSLTKYCTYPLVVLCSNELTPACFSTLKKLSINYIVHENDVLPSDIINAPEDERKEKFGDWQNTFFKLNMFQLEQYGKICYLDCDMIVHGNIDSLFDFPDFSAVPDSEFYNKETTALNSGVIVFCPRKVNMSIFRDNIYEMWENGYWPFGDQDIISRTYNKWFDDKKRHIPLKYNACVGRLHKYNNIGKICMYHYANHYKPWNMKHGYLVRIVHCIITFRWRTLYALLLAFYYNKLARYYIGGKDKIEQ